jgi:hypothetical protein
VLNVPSAGQRTFTVTSDDGFVLGIQGAVRVSGPAVGTPAVTVFKSYAVMGGVNARQVPVAQNIVVNFPAAGSYAYELDYAKGGDTQMTLTVLADGAAIGSTALLSLSPTTTPSTAAVSGTLTVPVGRSGTFAADGGDFEVARVDGNLHITRATLKS